MGWASYAQLDRHGWLQKSVGVTVENSGDLVSRMEWICKRLGLQ